MGFSPCSTDVPHFHAEEEVPIRMGKEPGPSLPRPRPRPIKRRLEEVGRDKAPQIEDGTEVLEKYEGSFSCIQNSEGKLNGGKFKKRRT